jgi:hypothetical protein
MNGVAGAITAYHQANLMQQVQTSMLAKTLDVAQTQGQAVVSLIQSAGGAAQQITDPALGRLVDTTA